MLTDLITIGIILVIAIGLVFISYSWGKIEGEESKEHEITEYLEPFVDEFLDDYDDYHDNDF